VTPEESQRLEAIERRLAWIESRLGKPPEPEAPASPRVVPITPYLERDELQRKLEEIAVAQGKADPADVRPTGPRPVLIPETAAQQAPAPQASGPERERRGAHSGEIERVVGLTWLSRIAVLTIVLFLTFFFKYAFQNHWITEGGRVILGLVCGAGALAIGELFWRRGEHTYAQSLTAVGIAFLYLSCWASFGLYHLISQTAAFAAMVLATIAAGGLALRYDSQVVALLGLAGGFATPLLLGAMKAPAFVFGYALVLDLGTAFASRRREWRWPEPLALAGTAVLFLSQLPATDPLRHIFALFAGGWYILFAASKQRWVVAMAQVLAALATLAIFERAETGLVAILMLGAAGLAIADVRRWTAVASASFAGFWFAYWMWSLGSEAAARPVAVTILTLGFLMFLSWLVGRVLVRREPLGPQHLLILVLNAGFYLGSILVLVESGWRGVFTVALALAHLGAARLLWHDENRRALLAGGVAGALLTLAAPIQFVGYRITISWALEGAALAWIGARFRERRITTAALVVFVLAAWRLALFDGNMYSTAAAYALFGNARFITFAFVAASLCATAWWIRTGAGALASYLGGLAVLLWGLCLEAAGWAARTAPQDVRSSTSMAISVVAAAYAVVLVSGGVMRRSTVTRVAGIVLIAMVVAKLYFYDVWLLAQLYRMTAFGILGVLLLAMSYVYTKKREQ
jgi:hypothetical protein